jgi:hypothetical protein
MSNLPRFLSISKSTRCVSLYRPPLICKAALHRSAMASSPIIRVTLFKIPKKEDRDELIKYYEVLSRDQSKVSYLSVPFFLPIFLSFCIDPCCYDPPLRLPFLPPVSPSPLLESQLRLTTGRRALHSLPRSRSNRRGRTEPRLHFPSQDRVQEQGRL